MRSILLVVAILLLSGDMLAQTDPTLCLHHMTDVYCYRSATVTFPDGGKKESITLVKIISDENKIIFSDRLRNEETLELTEIKSIDYNREVVKQSPFVQGPILLQARTGERYEITIRLRDMTIHNDCLEALLTRAKIYELKEKKRKKLVAVAGNTVLLHGKPVDNEQIVPELVSLRPSSDESKVTLIFENMYYKKSGSGGNGSTKGIR
jgi:hypothetical protein